MKLFLALLFFSCVFDKICTDEGEKSHPFGRSEFLVNFTRNDNNVNLHPNYDFINKLFLHPEIKDRKIVILSIIGAYRHGKSFFLNYCLRYLYATYPSINSKKEFVSNTEWLGNGNEPLTGFGWAHGTTPNTKGIMMWSDVFLHETNSDKIAIFIMDTQGLFEPKATDEENAKIFGLNSLMTSIQIINIKDRIEERDIVNLDTVIGLTKFITEKGENTSWKPFQNLLFLFRDFYDDDYGIAFAGGQKYLDDFLQTSFASQSKSNLIRQKISSSFEEISCFLLDYPGPQIKRSNGRWSILESDFVTHLKMLIESLLAPSKLIKKSVLGEPVVASAFRNLIEGYFKAYENFTAPPSASIFDISMNNQMQSIVDYQFGIYEEAMNEDVDLDREKLIDWWNKKQLSCRENALNGFKNAKKFKDQEVENKFKDILERKIQDTFDRLNAIQMRKLKMHQFKSAVEKQFNLYKTDLVVGEENYSNKKFVEWLQTEHERAKLKSVNGIYNSSSFYDPETEEKFVKILEVKINEDFEKLNATCVTKYTSKHFQSLLDDQSKIYLAAMEVYAKNYKNDNYLNLLNQTHTTQKAEALQGFYRKRNYPNLEGEQLYSNLLEKNLENYFLFSYDTRISVHNFHMSTVKSQMRQHIKSIINDFNTKIDISAYKNPSDQANDFRNLQTISKANFQQQTNYLNSVKSQNAVEHELETEMSTSFNEWKHSILVQKQNSKNYPDECLETYKLIEYARDVNNYLRIDFKDHLEETHSQRKETAFKCLAKKMENYKSNSVKSHVKNELTKKMNAFFEGFKSGRFDKFDRLRGDGIWVPVDIAKKTVPEYAAVAGAYGGDTYVIRTLFSFRGTNRGMIAGEYSAVKGKVMIPYSNWSWVYYKGIFSVLTHTNYEFVDKSTNKRRILVGHNYVNDPIYICRSYNDESSLDKHIINGKEVDGTCYICWSDDEKSFDDYQVMVVKS